MSLVKKYHKLEFSALEDEILIEKVKENPPLYAKKLKSYKDMKMKDNIWAKIAREIGECGFNRTGEECKKRWSNLRDYYVRKKKGNSTGSAASCQGNEKFEHMKFLDNTAFVHRTTKSNVPTSAIADEQLSDDDERVEGASDIESQNEETENHCIIIEETVIEETPIEEIEQMSETQTIATRTTQFNKVDKADVVPIEKTAGIKRVIQCETRGKVDAKKARTQLLQDIDKGRSERMTLLRDIAQRATTPLPQATEDPIDMFFKSLAATAKTLSPRNLAEAKRKLFLTMAEIEEKDIEEKYPLSNPSPTPLFVPTPMPSSSLSLPYSDDSNSACHVIGQKKYGHPVPSYNSPPTNQEPMIPSDCTVQSYLTAFTPGFTQL